MPKTAKLKPTELELRILKVLWRLGPSTVRAVMDVMSHERPIGYTTVLKMLQIMRDEGLALCDAARKPHVYRARHPQRTTLRRLAGDVLERAFNGSAHQMLLHALEHRRVSADELSEIRRLLDDYERGRS